MSLVFLNLGAPEISGICTAIVAVIGAIGGFIYKCRGRSWREIFKSVVEGQNEDIKELSKTLVEETKVVGSIVSKVMEGKKDKKEQVKK